MTSEEYIEDKFKGNTDMYAYHVCKKAVEMARKEERKKAIDTFKAVSMIIMSPFVSDDELDKAANGLVDIVTELLNK